MQNTTLGDEDAVNFLKYLVPTASAEILQQLRAFYPTITLRGSSEKINYVSLFCCVLLCSVLLCNPPPTPCLQYFKHKTGTCRSFTEVSIQ